jgi:hypothetical protein
VIANLLTCHHAHDALGPLDNGHVDNHAIEVEGALAEGGVMCVPSQDGARLGHLHFARPKSLVDGGNLIGMNSLLSREPCGVVCLNTDR